MNYSIPTPYVGGRIRKLSRRGGFVEKIPDLIKQGKDIYNLAQPLYKLGKMGIDYYRRRKNEKNKANNQKTMSCIDSYNACVNSKKSAQQMTAVHQEPNSNKVTYAKDMNYMTLPPNMKSNPTTDGKGMSCSGGKCGKKMGHTTKFRSMKYNGGSLMRGPIA